jgi:hypothetical protein
MSDISLTLLLTVFISYSVSLCPSIAGRFPPLSVLYSYPPTFWVLTLLIYSTFGLGEGEGRGRQRGRIGEGNDKTQLEVFECQR